MKKQNKISDKTGIALILILSFFSCLNTSGQSFSWSKKSPMAYPVVAQSACFYEGKIYVIGGSTDGALHGGDYGDPFLQIYDLQTDTWSTGSPMPTGRWMHGSAEVNSVIYCIGGGWNNPLSINEAYDIASGTWSTKTPMPYVRASVGVAAVDNKIYVIGGFGLTQCYPINQMYDPETDTWTTKASMSTSKCGFGIAVVDGKIYTIGGSNSPSNALKIVEVYDPLTNTWQTKSSMPSARFGLVAVSVGKKIYAMGGTPSNTIPSPGKFEVYDTETDTWETLDNLPDSTQWAAAVSWNNKVYLMGGEDRCLMTYPTTATILDFLYECNIVTGISDENYSGNNPFMFRAYPNPFISETTLSFEIPEKEWIKLEVYNAMGEKILTLADGIKPQGINSIYFNEVNLPTGMYFCRLSTGNKTETIKLLKTCRAGS